MAFRVIYSLQQEQQHSLQPGTGDLFSSTMCGLRVNGYATEEALTIAGDFLYHSIADAMESGTDGNDGIAFEKHLSILINYAK